jgi:hypothetical protein
MGEGKKSRFELGRREIDAVCAHPPEIPRKHFGVAPGGRGEIMNIRRREKKG